MKKQSVVKKYLHGCKHLYLINNRLRREAFSVEWRGVRDLVFSPRFFARLRLHTLRLHNLLTRRGRWLYIPPSRRPSVASAS